MASNKYRILDRFSLLVRVALKGIKFTKYREGGYVCDTGRCPMAVAVELSGGQIRYFPGGVEIAREMLNIGLIEESELDKVRKEADNFIGNYPTRNYTWKQYLGV